MTQPTEPGVTPEAFRLYEELRGLIRHQVATTIFRVTVNRQPHVHGPAPAGPAGATAISPATVSSGSATAAPTCSR